MAVHFTGPKLFAGKDGQREWFGNLPIDKNPDFVVYFDDFTGVTLDNTNDWTVVKDSSASAAIGADQESGTLVLSSQATTDNDGASIQGNEIFKIATGASGRDIWYETKVKVADADQTDLSIGMTVNFATNPEAMLAAADRIVFESDDGTATLQCITEKDGTETATALSSDFDLSDDTFVTLGFKVSGKDRTSAIVEFYVNRTKVATHTTNIPDDENLALGAMELSGDASGTKTATIDYIFACQNR